MYRRLLERVLIPQRLRVDIGAGFGLIKIWCWVYDGIFPIVWPLLRRCRLCLCFGSLLDMSLGSCSVEGVDVHSQGI